MSMAAQDSPASVFGHLLPGLSAQGSSQTAAEPGRPQRQEQQQQKRQRAQRGQRPSRHATSDDILHETVILLAALTLQQEDSLSRIKMSTAFTIYMEHTRRSCVASSLRSFGGMVQEAGQGRKGRSSSHCHIAAARHGDPSQAAIAGSENPGSRGGQECKMAGPI